MESGGYDPGEEGDLGKEEEWCLVGKGARWSWSWPQERERERNKPRAPRLSRIIWSYTYSREKTRPKRQTPPHRLPRALLSPGDPHSPQTLPPIPRILPHPLCNPDGRDNFGLRPIADFTTTRDTFLSDARFRVVLDETCFGHRVGEVEVEVEVPAAAAGGEEKQVQREIDGFMERYAWFFLVEKAKVKGKLTAYFERFPVKI